MIAGIAKNSAGLYPHAVAILPCNNAWSARRVPHPGQSYPVSNFDGQRGYKLTASGLYLNKIVAAMHMAAATSIINAFERFIFLVSKSAHE